jgi:hypothetical protein
MEMKPEDSSDEDEEEDEAKTSPPKPKENKVHEETVENESKKDQ